MLVLLKKISLITILLICIGLVFFKFLTIKIPAGCIGVRTRQFGKKGIEQKDFKPGWHRNIPFFDKWDIYDSTVQTLEFTADPEHGDRLEADAIQVTAKDATLDIDISVKYRIKPGHFHAFAKEHRTITTAIEDLRGTISKYITGTLGTLYSYELYSPEKRNIALDTLNNKLQEDEEFKNLEIINILIHNISFNERFEEKILQKVVVSQQEKLKSIEEDLESKRGIRLAVEAETQKKLKEIVANREKTITLLEAEANKNSKIILSEANAYSIEKRAEADKEKLKNESQGQKLIETVKLDILNLKNQALNSEAGKNLATLEAVRNLNIEELIINTQKTDFLNINEMLQKLGIPAGAQDNK